MTFKEVNTAEYCLNLEKRIRAHFIMLEYIYKTGFDCKMVLKFYSCLDIHSQLPLTSIIDINENYSSVLRNSRPFVFVLVHGSNTLA